MRFNKLVKKILLEAIPLKYAKDLKLAYGRDYEDEFSNYSMMSDEEVPFSLTRKNSSAYRMNILNKIFGEKDRLIYDIDIDVDHIIKRSHIYPKLERLLRTIGFAMYNTKDYINGVAYPIPKKKENETDEEFQERERKTQFKNPTKIGKILNRYEKDNPSIITNSYKELKISFYKDPLRDPNNTFKVVISRHPYDIAGMSTDRRWVSCMALGIPGVNYRNSEHPGCNSKFVIRDIRQGSIVSYLVSSTDVHENGKLAIRYPIARILMKRCENTDGLWVTSDSYFAYTRGSLYPQMEDIPEFETFIDDWLEENINIKSAGRNYRLSSGLYDDNDVAVNFNLVSISQIVYNEFIDMVNGSIEDAYFHMENNEYLLNNNEFGIKLSLEGTYYLLSIPFKINNHNIDYEMLDHITNSIISHGDELDTSSIESNDEIILIFKVYDADTFLEEVNRFVENNEGGTDIDTDNINDYFGEMMDEAKDEIFKTVNKLIKKYYKRIYDEIIKYGNNKHKYEEEFKSSATGIYNFLESKPWFSDCIRNINYYVNNLSILLSKEYYNWSKPALKTLYDDLESLKKEKYKIERNINDIYNNNDQVKGLLPPYYLNVSKSLKKLLKDYPTIVKANKFIKEFGNIPMMSNNEFFELPEETKNLVLDIQTFSINPIFDY